MTEKSEQNSAHVEYPRRYQIDGMITTKRQIKFRVSMINTKKKKKDGSNIMISNAIRETHNEVVVTRINVHGCREPREWALKIETA